MRVDLHQAGTNTATRRLRLSGAVDTGRLRTLLAALESVAWFRFEGGVLTVAYDVGKLDFAALVTELENAGMGVDESGFKRWRGVLYRFLDGNARGHLANQPTCCGHAPPAVKRRRH